MKTVLALALITILLLTACSGEKGMEAREVWVRSAQQGENGAAYFILHNYSGAADALLSAECTCAKAVEIHQSMESSGGVMQMAPLESVPLEANAEVRFEPGGLHLMLVNLQQDLKPGDEVIIILHFKHHPDLKITAPVQEESGQSQNQHSH